MKGIEVRVIAESHEDPAGMMMFLAKLTQRGHQVSSMSDLEELYAASMNPDGKVVRRVAALPHGTIKRFTPITIAIVGASRRFLAQARTHQVGMTFVSASLQYSDYSGTDSFVVPYELFSDPERVAHYISACKYAMSAYSNMVAAGIDHDTAGYVAPQGLRNVLIIQANTEAWLHFIRLRACNRNTVEMQYVTMLIWEALLGTADGSDLFAFAGPDCVHGKCREGKMSCGQPIDTSSPRYFIEEKWPLLKEAHDG